MSIPHFFRGDAFPHCVSYLHFIYTFHAITVTIKAWLHSLMCLATLRRPARNIFAIHRQTREKELLAVTYGLDETFESRNGITTLNIFNRTFPLFCGPLKVLLPPHEL